MAKVYRQQDAKRLGLPGRVSLEIVSGEQGARNVSLRFVEIPVPLPGEALTTREQEVLQLMAEGLPNRGIAKRLSISPHTVKFHVASILAKLGAESRTEAVHVGARRGLIAL